MSKKLLGIALVCVIGAVATACAPAQPNIPAPAEAKTMQGKCASYKTDNGISYQGADMSSTHDGPCLPIDTNVYKIRVEVVGETVSNSKVSGSMSGFAAYGFGAVNGRIWTDGKGVLLVRLVEINPSFGGFAPGDLIVIKTTDLKVINLPAGTINDLVCNRDTEVLSPTYAGQVLTDDQVTYELDWCRMVTPKIVATSTQ